MKKITKIEIENYKAYAKSYSIDIDNGQNLIIYGENGAGKSSLYQSVNTFFKNSIGDIEFEKNIFNENAIGNVKIEFADFIDSQVDNSTKNQYRFSSFVSNNKLPFIQEAALIKGFLDYTDLLNIYLKSSPNPNLFNLVVENLLKDFIPLSSGATISIGSTFNNIKNDLLKKSHTRRSKVHTNALQRLTVFERDLSFTLGRIFEKVNELLNEYFGFDDLHIDYILMPLEMSYSRAGKWNWKVLSDLRLVLKKGDVFLGTQYKDKLNEARLSSIAICIYLSSLILYPKNSELKLLYLDDIFVGLDSSNRLPILEIIKDCFKDFQIIISTYDKSFFNIAKLKLDQNYWLPYEFYVGNDMVNNREVEVPIILKSKDDYERGRFHLYNSFPDYPAAANYFRKAIEQILNKYFPKFLFKDGDFIDIETYKLSAIFIIAENFLSKVHLSITGIRNLRDFLYILLHPLSHYQIDASEYKRDLIQIEKLIFDLKLALPPLNLDSRFICVLEKGGKLMLELFVDPNKKHIYYFFIEEHLIFDKQTNKIANCNLFAFKMFNIDSTGGNITNEYKPNKNNSSFTYTSLLDAYSKISEYLVNTDEPNLVSNISYLKSFKVLKGENWEELVPLLK